jgi:hypothetical protein
LAESGTRTTNKSEKESAAGVIKVTFFPKVIKVA